jgi:general stress protein CsbA
MKKFLLIILFSLYTVSSYASEVATKDDLKILGNQVDSQIKMLSNQMKDNNRLIIELIKANQKATDKRFEDMNKRFDMLSYIMIAGFTLVFGYLIKDRKSITKDVREDISEYVEFKLTQKADLKEVENIINVLEKFGNKNPDIANILEKHNLRKA